MPANPMVMTTVGNDEGSRSRDPLQASASRFLAGNIARPRMDALVMLEGCERGIDLIAEQNL